MSNHRRMAIVLHITLISPLILTSGAPEYGRLDFNRHPDSVGAAITTCHGEKTKQFCLEKLHAYLFSRRCPDAQHNSRRCAAALRASNYINKHGGAQEPDVR